jgi:hypothetical protein
MSPLELDVTKPPLLLFRKSLAGIAYLRRIAFDLERGKVSKPFAKEEMLRKSYIVYLVATWQAFIESLVLDTISKLLAFDENETPPQQVWAKFTKNGRFSTPNMENIDDFIGRATRIGGRPGISSISDYWLWFGMSREQARIRLNNLLTLRHQLAHTGKSALLPSFEEAIEEMKFLDKLGEIMQSEIDKYVADQKRQAS